MQMEEDMILSLKITFQKRFQMGGELSSYELKDEYILKHEL